MHQESGFGNRSKKSVAVLLKNQSPSSLNLHEPLDFFRQLLKKLIEQLQIKI